MTLVHLTHKCTQWLLKFGRTGNLVYPEERRACAAGGQARCVAKLRKRWRRWDAVAGRLRRDPSASAGVGMTRTLAAAVREDAQHAQQTSAVGAAHT